MDASAKLGTKEALGFAASVSTVIVAKGKKVTSFSMNQDRPDDKLLLSHMLGPTGNLRAPTIRKGKTLLIGFNDEVYQAELMN